MSYNSELVSQLPPSLSSEENLKLVEKVRDSDMDARESMICGNTAWVMSLVDNHIKQFPFLAHLRDDLISAGFTGLVSAVNQLATDYDPSRGDFKDYIATAVLNEIYQTVETETTIPIPHATQYRKAAAGNKIKPMTAVVIPLENCPGDDMEASFDMRDLIESCCETDKDRTFVEMREAGYTLKEIADALGVSTPTVYRIKRELYARVLEKSGLQPDEKSK